VDAWSFLFPWFVSAANSVSLGSCGPVVAGFSQKNKQANLKYHSPLFESVKGGLLLKIRGLNF
jgi:hypothetical protein